MTEPAVGRRMIEISSEVAELTEQLHKSQAEVNRLLLVNTRLRDWWSTSAAGI